MENHPRHRDDFRESQPTGHTGHSGPSSWQSRPLDHPPGRTTDAPDRPVVLVVRYRVDQGSRRQDPSPIWQNPPKTRKVEVENPHSWGSVQSSVHLTGWICPQKRGQIKLLANGVDPSSRWKFPLSSSEHLPVARQAAIDLLTLRQGLCKLPCHLHE